MTLRPNSFNVICVNYKNELETASFVEKLMKQDAYDRIMISVVNNESTGGLSLDHLKHANCNVLTPGSNLGYMNAASYAVEHSRRNGLECEWIIVCNTDIDFTSSTFFSDISTYYPNGVNGVLAPRIIGPKPDALEQNPFLVERPSGRRLLLRQLVTAVYPVYVMRNMYWQKKLRRVSRSMDGVGTHPRHIYAPHGAFMIFHTSFFRSGASLHFPSFLYSEEIFVAEMLRRYSLECLFDPRLVVLHKEHSTTSLLPGRRKSRFMSQSYRALRKKFF